MRLEHTLVFVLLLAACSGGTETTSTPDPDPASASASICATAADTSAVVAEGGGHTVTQLEWDAELLTIPARARARYDNDKGKQDISERVLLNKALFAAADAQGLLDDPAIRMSARLAAEKAYITALLSSVESEAASDEAVAVYYDENKEKYSRPMARARHILVKDEALATDIHRQVTGGGDFAALAREHSEDRGSKAKGGELPWATKDRWVPEFANAAFAMEAHEISAPVKSKFGYHIIEVLEKRDMQPLEEVRPGIERVLTRNAVRDFRDGVKQELGIGKTRTRGGSTPVGARANDRRAPKGDTPPSTAPVGKDPSDKN